MFKCEISGKLSKPGEGSYRLIKKIRPRSYNREVLKGKTYVTVTTHGWEIEKESIVCKEVFEKYSPSLKEMIESIIPKKKNVFTRHFTRL